MSHIYIKILLKKVEKVGHCETLWDICGVRMPRRGDGETGGRGDGGTETRRRGDAETRGRGDKNAGRAKTERE
jgi:hypothetical protein